VGLIQREIESRGLVTVSISIVREYSEKIKPPRALFLRWPFGHPLGEPGNQEQQAAVLGKALRALREIERPGTIIDVGWPWRRHRYPPVPWLSTQGGCPE
jgi:hypothetical protein